LLDGSDHTRDIWGTPDTYVRVALELVEVIAAVVALGVVVDRERHADGQGRDHEQPRTDAGGDPRLPRQRHYHALLLYLSSSLAS
jgi:hypothetical protein